MPAFVKAVHVSEIDLSISVVSYNTVAYLRECLKTIFENTHGISFEIIVVDNASRDGSATMVSEQFPSVRLITNSENRYFTAAHNQALAIARGEWFLIINSDTLTLRDTLSTLLDFVRSNERVGVVTCREMDGHGELVITSTRFPSLLACLVEWTFLRNWPLRSVLDRYLMSDWKRDTPRTIDVGSGCFLMARTSLLRQFGGFDEGIRLYFSEHDLCQQIARAGFEVHFRPEVHYVHFGQRSSSQESIAVIRKIHFDDMLYYFTKYHGKVRAHAMMIAIRFFRFVERMLRSLSWRVVSPRRQGVGT
jgi:GT2 family glycosyltransferase